MPSFFRDVEMPSHAQEFRAYERFVQDTHAERRAQAQPTFMARVLATLGVQE